MTSCDQLTLLTIVIRQNVSLGNVTDCVINMAVDRILLVRFKDQTQIMSFSSMVGFCYGCQMWPLASSPNSQWKLPMALYHWSLFFTVGLSQSMRRGFFAFSENRCGNRRAQGLHPNSANTSWVMEDGPLFSFPWSHAAVSTTEPVTGGLIQPKQVKTQQIL